MTSLVLTLIGADRPGLVDSLARLVVEHGGNWVESRMSRLAGRFAGILQVDVPASRATALATSLRALAGDSLRLVVEGALDTAAPSATHVSLALVGDDRPGIVTAIARVLAAHQVNIEDLETECVPAPMSGERLFHFRARLAIPLTADQDALTADLERIAGDIMVDITLV